MRWSAVLDCLHLLTSGAFTMCGQSSEKLFASDQLPDLQTTQQQRTACTRTCSYFIPKGVTCINIRQCNHDRSVFGYNADDFKPERYLGDNGELLPGPKEMNQEGHVSFGFGRRVCVGKYLANDSLYIYSEDLVGSVPKMHAGRERK